MPPGEAPEWVREKWVGLSLPLSQRAGGAKTFFTAGVITGPRGFLPTILAWLTGKFSREEGYLVESRAAIEVLEEAHPDAAAWWRKNTPHLLRANRYLVFHPGAGHVDD